MSYNLISSKDLVIVRCDSVIDNCCGYGDLYEPLGNHERNQLNQLIQRFFTFPVSNLDLRAYCDLSSADAIDHIVRTCLDTKQRRILLTVDPVHVKTLAASLSVIAPTSDKIFAIAAVTIPAVLRYSDAEFVLGLALGSLCSSNSTYGSVSIAGMPSVLQAANGNEEVVSDVEVSLQKQPVLIDTEKWIFKKGSSTHYAERDERVIQTEIQPPNELLTRWLVSSTATSTAAQADFHTGDGEKLSPCESAKQNDSVLDRYFASLNCEPDMWLAKPQHISSRHSESESDFVMAASRFERSSSIRSCDLVPDIEELALCSASMAPTDSNGRPSSPASSISSTPRTQASVRTIRSNNSSWLKVICRASEPCGMMSECICEPNCSAALLQPQASVVVPQPQKQPEFPMFSLPMDPDYWLKSGSSNRSVIQPEPEAKITEKGSITFPAANDLDRWLANRGSKSG